MWAHTHACTTPQPFYWQNTTSWWFLKLGCFISRSWITSPTKTLWLCRVFISCSALSPSLSPFLRLTLPLSLHLTIIIVKRERQDPRYQPENNSQLKILANKVKQWIFFETDPDPSYHMLYHGLGDWVISCRVSLIQNKQTPMKLLNIVLMNPTHKLQEVAYIVLNTSNQLTPGIQLATSSCGWQHTWTIICLSKDSTLAAK